VRTKVDELIKRQDILENEMENYVTHKHLEAVIPPIQKVMEEVQRDIKKLLVLVSKADEHRSRY
jgi:hypothetical protein